MSTTRSVFSGHIILPPGEFNITAPIWIASDTTIEGSGPGQTIIRKTGAPFGHVFVNTAAASFGAEKNVNITLRNLTIDPNGIEIPVSESSPTTRGLCQFTYLDGLTVENVSFINGGLIQYGFHLQSVTNGSFKNISYHGGKTLCQMQAECADITFDGWESTGGDDAFACNAADWAGDAHRVGDIERITIRNGTILPYLPAPDATKNAVRFLPGSWSDWKEGNSYRIADYCVSGGNIYQTVNKGPALVASVAPAHTHGTVTGADGIAWQWLQPGTHHTANIRHVLVENVKIQDARQFGLSVQDGPDMRPEYPGTEGSSEVSDVVIRNVTSSPSSTVPLVNFSGGHSANIVLDGVVSSAFFYCLRVVGGRHDSITLRNVPIQTGPSSPIICQLTSIGSLALDGVTVNGRPSIFFGLREFVTTDRGSIQSFSAAGQP